MTTIEYEWTNGKETKKFKTYPDVTDYVAEHGGQYQIIETEQPSSDSIDYAVAGHRTAREWKNYKF